MDKINEIHLNKGEIIAQYETLGSGNILVRKCFGGNPVTVGEALRAEGFTPWFSCNSKFVARNKRK